MSKSNQLSLEQKFKLAQYRKEILALNDQQVKKYLFIILKNMMIKDNIVKYLIQNTNL